MLLTIDFNRFHWFVGAALLLLQLSIHIYTTRPSNTVSGIYFPLTSLFKLVVMRWRVAFEFCFVCNWCFALHLACHHLHSLGWLKDTQQFFCFFKVGALTRWMSSSSHFKLSTRFWTAERVSLSPLLCCLHFFFFLVTLILQRLFLYWRGWFFSCAFLFLVSFPFKIKHLHVITFHTHRSNFTAACSELLLWRRKKKTATRRAAAKDAVWSTLVFLPVVLWLEKMKST